jgi:hypothetical protein
MAAEQEGGSTSSRPGRAAGGQRVHSLRRGASPVPGPRACPRGGLRFPPPSGDALQVIARVIGLYCIVLIGASYLENNEWMDDVCCSWEEAEEDRVVFFPTTRTLKGYPIILRRRPGWDV